MPKSAAAIAKELSDHESKNQETGVVATEAEEMGGIAVEPEVVEEPKGRTGTPFDLVEGRPNIDFWGPFEAYQFVTTPAGEYAVPHGKILRLERREEFDKKEGMMVMRTYPIYEKAPQELIDYIAG